MPDIVNFNVTTGWREQSELTQHQIAQYYHVLSQDKLIEPCFYDGSVRNYVDFFSFCLDRTNLFLIVYERNTQIPVAHVTLNCFEGYTCRLHFGITRAGHGRHRSLDIGYQVLTELFNMTRSTDGTPVTRMLVGVTPTKNKLACRYIQELGFKPKVTLDKSCYIAKNDTYSDGLLTVMTKAQFEEDLNGWKERSRIKVTGRI